jgi:DNA polymerase III subunit delta
MTFEEVEKNWKAGKAKPVYVFHGEEEFLRSELLHTAPALFVPDEGTRSFNFDLLYGAETNLQNVLSLAQSYPVMADRRLLIVREADKIMKSKAASTSSKSKKGAKSEDLMSNYLASPQPETILIFDMIKMGPKNTNPWKDLAAKAEVIEFPIMKEPAIVEWLKQRAKKHQKQLTDQAARLIVGHLGTSLRTHANELEKLMTYVGERVEINEKDVEEVVGVSRSYNVFELTKAIGTGDKAKCAEIILRMLAHDKDQRQLLFVMIARYFEQLIITQEMLVKGEKEPAIAEAIELRGGAAYFVREFITAAKRYRRDRLDHAMRSIVEAESTTRRVQLDDALIFERLLTQIMPA